MASSQQAARRACDSSREFIESASRCAECEPAFHSAVSSAVVETTVTSGFHQMQPFPIQQILTGHGEESKADMDQGFGHGGALFVGLALMTLTFWTLVVLSAVASLPLHLVNQPW